MKNDCVYLNNCEDDTFDEKDVYDSDECDHICKDIRRYVEDENRKYRQKLQDIKDINPHLTTTRPPLTTPYRPYKPYKPSDDKDIHCKTIYSCLG